MASCAPNVKEPTLQLLYGRNISIHMAYDIRDALLALVLGHTSLSQKTKNWFSSTFGTDEGMMVSVHSPVHPFVVDLRLRCRQTHKLFGIF